MTATATLSQQLQARGGLVPGEHGVAIFGEVALDGLVLAPEGRRGERRRATRDRRPPALLGPSPR